jgi:uncharacterized protein (DUF4415 family)
MKKASIQVPTLEEDLEITNAANADPDATPLTEEQMGQMVPLKALRGRPRLANRKQLVSIRYSPEVLDYFRSSGAGWQSRMDAVLREYVESRSGFDAEGPEHGHAPDPPPQFHYALWGSSLVALCGQVMASVGPSRCAADSTARVYYQAFNIRSFIVVIIGQPALHVCRLIISSTL